MYTIKEFQMTPRTLVYQVYYDGEFCFQHMKLKSAENIIKAFERYNINDMQSWLNAPSRLLQF